MDMDPVISSQPKPAQGVAASDQYKESQQGAKSSDPVSSSPIPTEYAHVPISDHAAPGIKLSPGSHTVVEQLVLAEASNGEAALENSAGLSTEDRNTTTNIPAEQAERLLAPDNGQATSENVAGKSTEDIRNSTENANAKSSAAPSINTETVSLHPSTSEIGSDAIDVDSNVSFQF